MRPFFVLLHLLVVASFFRQRAELLEVFDEAVHEMGTPVKNERRGRVVGGEWVQRSHVHTRNIKAY